MYNNVWAWSGEFRKSNKNIGVDKWQIPTELRTLLDDTRFWYANNTCSPDETTIRFRHRLVSIHCFANGKGRHSRLMADTVIEKLFKLPHYTWGAATSVKPVRTPGGQGDTRSAYLNAIKAADNYLSFKENF